MIRRPPRSTLSSSSAASDVYKRQYQRRVHGAYQNNYLILIKTKLPSHMQLVQTFGRKKTAIAVASVRECKNDLGFIRVNGKPIDIIEPEGLRIKVCEPLLILGADKFKNLAIRVKVRGGGYVAQLYAIRQAICRGLVAYNQKFVDEQSKRDIKEKLLQYDRSLLIADPRRKEPKKFGGRGARSRRQKSYR
eukprot:TRINITY_DN365_c0_g1_i11.p1 TRINITY_DN365_c0_g1~~TRINITY_DN365_c0_g1_i11.p1  ORF type:complete len:191 (+),score=36.69 TRINITY_DN365_c0_g1_i11:122-694(+)